MVQERRPTIKEGSIHCPVRLMKHYVAEGKKGYLGSMENMIKQMREAWPTATAFEKSEMLWLGRRYQQAYKELTGKEFK